MAAIDKSIYEKFIIETPEGRTADISAGVLGFSYYENLYKKIAEESRKVGKGLLSLGMTQDLELALASGTNCIRIGTGLFGPRV